MREMPAGATLPIEWLRHDGAVPWVGNPPMRTFRSSGTTASNRSSSHFSAAGLEQYREGSVECFFQTLVRVLGRDARKVRGLSLVPRVAAWPDSSLAQMVAWIEEATSCVTYVDEASLVREVEAAEARGERVWLFGTAFHLLNAMDAGLARRLPAGSVIIETGGTKGRSREASREQLFAELSRSFEIPEKRIVSEYGMCELASQAYDVADTTSVRRSFRFPVWVRPSVMTAPGVIQDHGIGLLVVSDGRRVDVPWPIRTEDLVALEPDGSFCLLGRAPKTPLKGCSLNAEVAAPKSSTPASSKSATLLGETIALDEVGARTRAQSLDSTLREFLASTVAIRSLAAELGSDAAAFAALRDQIRAMPKSLDEWFAAAKRATASRAFLRDWLFILPQNHSLVGLHPLSLAYVAGINIEARVPHRFAHEESFLSILLAKFTRLRNAVVTIRPPEFRVGDSPLRASAIIAYGDDDTIDSIREASGVPVIGFGNKTAISIIDRATDTNVALAVQDALQLGQSGCMSARLLIVCEHEGPTQSALIACASAAGAAFWQHPLSGDAKVGLALEAARYDRLGFQVAFDAESVGAPLVAAKHLGNDSSLFAKLPDWMAERPFVIPMLLVKESDPNRVVKAIAAHHEIVSRIATITTDSQALVTLAANPASHYSPAPLTFRALGNAHVAFWNGTHEHHPLFVTH